MKASRLFFVAALLLLAGSARAQLAPVPGEQRKADREAVLKSLDRIFQGFIHQDREALHATHGAAWFGFLEGSRTVMHGRDSYMQATSGAMTSPVHMTGYKLLDVDVIFYGDIAIVPFVSEVEYGGPGIDTPIKNKLRILDVFAKVKGDWVQVATDTATSPDALQAQLAAPRTIGGEMKKNLLESREAVWRAFCANDVAKLNELVPEELIAIEGRGTTFHHRDDVLAAAKAFAESGAKLTLLEFPQTEIQAYGPTAILYTTYHFKFETGGKSSEQAGRATEIFVFRDGKWLNSGWHIDDVS